MRKIRNLLCFFICSFHLNCPTTEEHNITALWSESKAKAITAVNTELLDANWQTGKYIVEYELKGKDRAEYGKQLLVNLAKDLTARNGKGFSRSNLVYMRKFYLAFPICETMSHKLTWSHYFELLKCDNSLEMQFYYKECIKEGWKVRELKRQMKSCLFQRLALSTDKTGVLALANEGHQVQTPQDIIRDPFVLEFAGLPRQKRYKESDLEKALKDHMEQFLLGHVTNFICQSVKNCKRNLTSCWTKQSNNNKIRTFRFYSIIMKSNIASAYWEIGKMLQERKVESGIL